MRKLTMAGVSIFTCAALLCGCGSAPEATALDGTDQTGASYPENTRAPEEISPVLIRVDADTGSLDGSYEISDLLYGIFLEDINFAVDGGLYAEMVKNCSFEFGVHGITP